jgi:hypothetical protein
MSKYHNDATRASNPGSVSLSMEKLAALEPELLTERTFKCGPLCDVDHPSKEMIERAEEHLKLGDSRAALVVSVNPLLVAAYSDDLDATAILAFPAKFVEAYHLQPGTRLLTVNTYQELRDRRTKAMLYAVDLIPGPDRRRWSNFSPFIADFVSDDSEQIEARKRAIPEGEWNKARALAQVRLRELGKSTARDGRLTTAGTPVRSQGTAYFDSLHKDPVQLFLKRLIALDPEAMKIAVYIAAALMALLFLIGLLKP